jgi:GNAT superfamily N-acetyltransferase
MVRADAAAAAWFSDTEDLVDRVEHAHSERGEHGTALFVSGAALSSLNGVRTRHREVNADEVADFAERMSGAGLPWSIQTREAPGAEVVAIAEKHGLTSAQTVPLMVLDLGSRRRRDRAAEGPWIRTVRGAEATRYAEVMETGFGAAAGSFGGLFTPSTLDARTVTAYLAGRGDEATTTGMGTFSSDVAGVGNISTIPGSRRQGYATAMTDAILDEAVSRGMSAAYLQTSEAKSLYAAMGFRVVETWTYLRSPV